MTEGAAVVNGRRTPSFGDLNGRRTPSFQDFKDGRLFKVVSINRVMSYGNGLDQRTDVYRAAELGDSSRLGSLLTAGSTTDAWGKSFFVDMHDDVDWRNEEGETALYAACFNGHSTCVMQLIDANATIDLPDQAGHTPLTACCFKSRLKCAQLLLLAGADISRSSNKGKTALDWARWREQQPDPPRDATALRALLEDAKLMGPRAAVAECRAREKGQAEARQSCNVCRATCCGTPRDYCSPSSLMEQLSQLMTWPDPDEDDPPSLPTSPKMSATRPKFVSW